MTFAEMLEQAMDARGVGPSELVSMTGLDRKSVWAYRVGRVRPRAGTVAIIARALGAPELIVVPTEPVNVVGERLATEQLHDYQDAVTAFCTSCEPSDLICRDSKCELRAVSPLPFIPLSTRRIA